MLSVNLIDRFFRARRYEPLLEGLATNGMVLPLPLRVRLSQSPVPAVALGLRRLVELTYGPTSLSGEMTGFLLAAQAEDGSFDGDPLATAAAAAALGRVIHEQPAAADQAVTAARGRALAALAAMQNDSDLFDGCDDGTEQDRALTGAFVLYLLAGDDDFRQSVRYGDLMNWFEQHRDRLDADTNQLWRIARLDSPVATGPGAAVASFAA